MSGTDAAPAVLEKRSDLVSGAVVAAHVALVALPLYLAAGFPPGWTLLLFSVWFGLGMNGLLNLMHECAHLHVFRKPATSLLLGRWILGPLVLADFDGYQKRHWQHHRSLGKDEDPKYAYRTNIRGLRFVAFSLRCLFLVEAVKKFAVQKPVEKTEGKGPSGPWWILRALLLQALLGASLVGVSFLVVREPVAALLRAAWVYGAVYLYGIAATTVWVSSLRAIAEHQPGPDGARATGQAALRNFTGGLFTGFLLGAYGFRDHASHHSEPGVPYYRLRARTAELAATDPALAPKSPYEGVLWSLIR